jgi:hypothetical protein
VSDLKGSAATPLTMATTTRLLASSGGVDGVITGSEMKSFIGDCLGNWSTAAQTPAAATLTYITGSSIAVPTGYLLRAGTQFRWQLEVSKTAFGTAARTFHIRVGTTGTTTDAAVLTFTSTSAPTAAADVGRIEIIATVRVAGATATMKGSLLLTHNGNTAGLASIPVHIISPAVSSSFNGATAGLVIGLSLQTGTAEVITIEQVLAEAKQL